jgi:hypothetical protein
MSLFMRKQVVLAKIESVYGTDPTPDGTSNAILVRNLSTTLIDASTVNRQLIRAYLGNSDQILTQMGAALEFEVEMAGAGAAGAVPAWGPLIKACAFTESTTTNSISITRSSTTATVTETTHGRTTGDIVKISGASQTEYNGNQTITVSDANTYTYTVSGSPATPATGSPVAGLATTYTPLSASFPSVTLYYHIDGARHKITGARGTVAIDLAVKQIPVLKFKFQGVYNDPTDTALPTADYSSFQIPKVANTTFTSAFSLFSYSGKLESMSLDMANDVQHRVLIGGESIEVIDRKPSGTFVIERPTIAQKDYFSIAKAGTTGALALTHGTVGGNIVALSAPRVSIGNIAQQESQGVAMLSIPFVAAPSSSGNDEVSIAVK